MNTQVTKELIALRCSIPKVVVDGNKSTLAERFLVPPFSILDARQGYWQKRKKAWLALGIQSELGRGVNLGDLSASVAGITDPEEVKVWNEARRKGSNGLLGISKQARSHYRGTEANSFNSGRPGDLQKGFQVNAHGTTMQPGRNGRTGDGSCADGTEVHPQSGTSIFDPVLCELAYRWFCPKDGKVLDPFAGGSVRGITAALLGRSYAGVDLRQEQVDANYDQAENLCPNADITWAVGDSMDIEELLPDKYDFVFSCPPYGDLERYSDDPRDLSTMPYNDFLSSYGAIITRSCYMLKPDRFACFVVGDIRDRITGNYRSFVSDTIHAFKLAGLSLYNDAVLITAVGSLPIRVGAQFKGYRKLGKTHQNVLVFLKGDAALASEACGEVDIDDLQMPSLEEGKLCVCMLDVKELPSAKYLEGSNGDLSDCAVIQMPILDSALLCDILRGEAIVADIPTPRIWLGGNTNWQRIDDTQELTYMVNGVVYLNKIIFPNSPRPVQTRPQTKRMRE